MTVNLETHLRSHPKIVNFTETVDKHFPLVIEALWDGPKAFLLTLIQKHLHRDLIVITHAQTHLFQDLEFFLKQTPLEFPTLDLLALNQDPDFLGQRHEVLQQLYEAQKPQVVFMQLSSFLEKLPSPSTLANKSLLFEKNNEVPFELLEELLISYGYKKRSVVMEKKEFAIRGGILDVFAISEKQPCRIEFDEDRVISLRYFDPIAQTSVVQTDSLKILTANEEELSNQASILDYTKDPIVVFDDVFALEDAFASIKKTLSQKQNSFFSLSHMLELVKQNTLFFTSQPLENLSETQVSAGSNKTMIPVAFEVFLEKHKAYRFVHPFYPISSYFLPFDDPSLNQVDHLFKQINSSDVPALFLASSEKEKMIVEEKIENPSIEKGYLSSGFVLDDPSYALIPYTEFTHRYRIRRQQQRVYHSTHTLEMSKLVVGDYVVHMKHGIGLYLGIEKKSSFDGIEQEYMLLEYEGKARLFVPLDQSHLITKYIGVSEEPPKLDTLGSSRFERAKAKTQQAILGYAHDLLKLEAERNASQGFAYAEDSDMMKQFEMEFPYEETPDQKIAIEQIKQDMINTKVMDRLLCGDVGYGKTEVAMRAAFKAVCDGNKQVAVLVPTTILALQHYENFISRMANFPVRIGILSRMSKPKEMKQTLEKLASNEIDIVIGTHKLISKDVTFKDLGLLIIDEEQRFGVKVKEHLKTLKADIDCLTMSATPIPRTLYMSLVGAKQMSVINTPPQDRLPIQSVVCTKTDALFKETLLRELAREGQAFVIHNRVETIDYMASYIRNLVPHARILVAHGQMSAADLDKIFHLFKQGQADILVATSIIENGVDIPNANTILIDRSERFGLADLYQMRGRVGRWNRKAYCYFTVPRIEALSELSRKRLQALAESTGHGAGMKLAMHDLELRGAGNILGTEQSGFVSQVGFHLYCKMLKKAVDGLQHKGQVFFTEDVKIELPVDAKLSENYVNDMSLRLELYHRLGECQTQEHIETLVLEIKDRFGSPPLCAQWLFAIARLKLYALQNRLCLIKHNKRLLVAEKLFGKKKETTKVPYTLPDNPQDLLPSIKKALAL